MKTKNSTQAKKITFALILAIVLFFSGSVLMAQQSLVANSNTATPALMLTFTGVVDQNAGQLTWETENETSAKWFVVERAENGNEFDSIGMVPCVNNANATSYDYVDNHISGGNNYYRLREVDNDGVSRYSKIISLNNTNVSDKMQVFPNPAIAVVNYSVTSHVADQVVVQIYSLSGVLVNSHQQAIAAGLTQQSIAISDLKSGNYILKITGKQGMQYTQLFAKI